MKVLALFLLASGSFLMAQQRVLGAEVTGVRIIDNTPVTGSPYSAQSIRANS